jgi:cytoskeletal protein CcmA (bactofilin family)
MKLMHNSLESSDVSILGEGMEVTGQVKTKGSLRVDGKVIGNVHVEGNLTIGEKGAIKGDVEAYSMTVGGHLNGAARIQEKVKLESNARMRGDIFAKILIVESGALFNGKSEMQESIQQEQNAADSKE